MRALQGPNNRDPHLQRPQRRRKIGVQRREKLSWQQPVQRQRILRAAKQPAAAGAAGATRRGALERRGARGLPGRQRLGPVSIYLSSM